MSLFISTIPGALLGLCSGITLTTITTEGCLGEAAGEAGVTAEEFSTGFCVNLLHRKVNEKENLEQLLSA